MAHFLISAAHKSSGKTTITLGLCAALKARGVQVQPFKKGPDYIDPLWLSQAAGRCCHNLDFYTMQRDEIVNEVAKRLQTADIGIIEGNKGLYDGLDLAGSNSNAALAHLLGAPVVLVLDTQGMTRGIAPLVLGYQQFDPELNIAGVILNQVGGHRHETKLRQALERYTDIAVLGAVHRDPQLGIVERHLGLMPSNEDQQAQAKIATISQLINQQVDLERLLDISQQALSLPRVIIVQSAAVPRVTLGVIRDAAFGFYYPGDLAALEAAGAQLVFIDALHMQRLPPVDGLFIGGGFPETQMSGLEHNHALRAEIRQAIETALPVYAECGGLMYLARQITWHDKTCAMVGALPFDIVMEARPQGKGYVHLQETGHALWPLKDEHDHLASFAAHEFHYSRAVNIAPQLKFAYQVLRGVGLDGHHDGVIYKNTLASYAHLRDVNHNHWSQRFVTFVHQQKQVCATT